MRLSEKTLVVLAILIPLAAPTVIQAGAVLPTSVTINGAVNLTTNLADPVLLYSILDGSAATTLGVAPLGTLLPSGAFPFSVTVPAIGIIPAGFVSGEATIMGLYSLPSSVMMVFNTALYSSIISGGTTTYATMFPSPNPSEATLAAAIASSSMTASQAALENFFAANASDWVPFTLSTTNYVTGAIEFSAGQNGGAFTIGNVTAASTVPEPSTWMLMGIGLVLLASWKKIGWRKLGRQSID